jgi:hypothetical protein
MIRTYQELRRHDTFLERFRYLNLVGTVGASTFGFDRWINQKFYRSKQWKDVRNYVISRDEGCDLGLLGYEIHTGLLIHHMNPMTVDDLIHGEAWILNPDYLITTTHDTHNAIHYGDERQLRRPFVPRTAGDTKLW